MSGDKPTANPIAIESFIVQQPLYSCITEADCDLSAYTSDILNFRGIIDFFCPDCGATSTFRGVVTKSTDEQNRQVEHAKLGGGLRFDPFHQRRFDKLLVCARESSHTLTAIFFRRSVGEVDTLEKIGQSPSTADVSIGEISKYSKVIGSQQFKELKTGLGLAAHGVGIGSFVYLRRVIEHLIDDARAKAVAANLLDEAKYKDGRTTERIRLLKGFLPDMLVENANLYGILSKGVHELTEDECLKAFEPVKLAIEMVLDEVLANAERESKRKVAVAMLGKIATSLGPSGTDSRG
ncbi:MAG: hypothetical protein ACK5D9_01630 [Burkholderiales bacterium]|jgi:hypothetical protein